MEKVSLYIPCYNAENSIKECLDSVISQSYEIDEILVIDDGSKDKTIEIVRRYPVKIISHNENKGLATCRNTAFKETKNKFVAALDADCVASPWWLEKLMEYFISDDIAGIGGKIIERYALSPADKWRSIHMSQQWGSEPIENPPFLYGSNTVFKRKAVEKIGFYNEKFKTNYEDIDLSKRIYDSGLRLIYNPRAQAEHIRRDTNRSVLTTYWYWLYYKHMNPIYTNRISRRIASRFGAMVEYTEFSSSFFREDLQDKNYKLLPVDFIFAFYCYWLELKHFIKGDLS